MAVRIFQNGGMVEVAVDGKEVEMIPSRSFHFEIESTTVSIQDVDKKSYQRGFLYADVKDINGDALPVVGTLKQDVKDYLAPFVGFNLPGGAGSTTFLALLDTFASFAGLGGKVLAVNAGETAVVGIVPSLSARNNITLDLTNNNRVFLNDEFANVDTTGVAGGILHLFLPPLAGATNFFCRARKKDSTANILRIHADGLELIDGAAFVDIAINDGGLGFLAFGDEWGAI